MKIIHHGHSCFELKGEAGTVLIDPFISGNSLVTHIRPQDFQDVTAILVSHGHGDHFGDTAQIAENTGAFIIAVFELAKYCVRMGLKTHRMHIGGKHRFPFGSVKLTQAIHGSAVDGEDGSVVYTGLACGFLIEMDGFCLYHAGDTGLFGDMELIGKLNSIDVAMIPIGDNYVMGPEDAAYACGLLKAKLVIPMHYNTFPEIKQDVSHFGRLLQQTVPEAVCLPLKPGESYEMG